MLKTHNRFKETEKRMVAFRNRAAMTATLLSEMHSLELCMSQMLKYRRSLRQLNKRLVASLAEPDDTSDTALLQAEMQVCEAKGSLMQYARSMEQAQPFTAPMLTLRQHIYTEFFCRPLLCPICRERRPISGQLFASCWHHVCKVCLPQYDKVSCPTCRATVLVYLGYVMVGDELYFRLYQPHVANPGKTGRLLQYTACEETGRRMVMRVFNSRINKMRSAETAPPDTAWLYMVQVLDTKEELGMLFSLGDFNIPEHLLPEFAPH